MAKNGDDWNDDIREDIPPPDYSGLVVYSRDWTVDTILSQLRQGNIDVDPKFQRRNAWKDKRRSLLIESLIVGVPVPELVLAECAGEKRNTFVVIDGKQRLLTIAGFVDHDEYQFWEKPVLSELKTRKSMSKKSYEGLDEDERRALMNADIRCTVISNYKSDDVLYDIFYRLNTGSVALSTQELRQVLKRGPFANFLVDVTNQGHPVQQVLGLDGPDDRLRDIEVLLRHLAWEFGTINYHGNLKNFLDETMAWGNTNWAEQEKNIQRHVSKAAEALALGEKLMGSYSNIGRRRELGKWVPQFNKALFEVEAFYLRRLLDSGLKPEGVGGRLIRDFVKAMDALMDDDAFARAIETTTKSIEQTKTRFERFEEAVNSALHTKFTSARVLFPGTR